MKKFIIVLVLSLVLGGIAFASVNILSDGTNLGPAQDVNFTGGNVSGSGPTKTVALGTATITSGTINGATVGATTPASGSFTTLVATAPNFTDGTLNGADINWSTVTGDMLKTNTNINWSDVTGL